LGHEPSHPHGLPGGQEVIGARGPQAVGQGEVPVEVTQVQRSDRGQLMDDHVGLHRTHSLRDLVGIERVGDHRHRAQLGEHRRIGLAARHAMHLMTSGSQTRHQVLSDRSGRSCHKHLHRQLLWMGEHLHPT